VGTLPAALAASEDERFLLCPSVSASEAAWVGATQVIGAKSLQSAVQHFTGNAPITPAEPGEIARDDNGLDFKDVKGQERAKRAMKIAAAGRHHLLLAGPPGSGKSMLAARLSGIMPDLSPSEALETSMIHSLAGLLDEGGISRTRPFREPHHTASMAAIIGGGRGAKPGEVSLAHNGVLFLDEFPEFARNTLETLRQPVETGSVVVARANAHVRYPCRFMLVAAANPCKCGHLTDPEQACSRAPICGEDYMGRISGPLLDRFDLRIEVPPVAYTDLDIPCDGASSAEIRQRVRNAHDLQSARYQQSHSVRSNADAQGELLEEIATPDPAGRELLLKVAEKFKLSARGYHRILRVARTIADLDGVEKVQRQHIGEAASFRLMRANEFA
ncbi:MAG: YifB family Mg chelatase-like AAA ATPase, partial [Paracoccaceae bacterium]|nr:YifB family Mg chelatase-like AAA ATPase [Paracoccaceae bacterium]